MFLKNRWVGEHALMYRYLRVYVNTIHKKSTIVEIRKVKQKMNGNGDLNGEGEGLNEKQIILKNSCNK